MSISLFAAEEGHLKEVELSDVVAFELALLAYAKAEHGSLLEEINEKCELSDQVKEQLSKLVETFKETQSW